MLAEAIPSFADCGKFGAPRNTTAPRRDFVRYSRKYAGYFLSLTWLINLISRVYPKLQPNAFAWQSQFTYQTRQKFNATKSCLATIDNLGDASSPHASQ